MSVQANHIPMTRHSDAVLVGDLTRALQDLCVPVRKDIFSSHYSSTFFSLFIIPEFKDLRNKVSSRCCF